MAQDTLANHNPTSDEIRALGWAGLPADWLTTPRPGDGIAISLYRLYRLRGDRQQAQHWLEQIQDAQERRDLTRRDFFATPPT